MRILSVGGRSRDLGPEHVVEAMFTTISCRLEPQGRGTRFPALMDDLYAGYLKPGRAAEVLWELQKVEADLRKVPVRDVVWSLANFRQDDCGPMGGKKPCPSPRPFWTNASDADIPNP